MAKLIDGNIHIDDEASQALNATEKALKRLEARINKVLKSVGQLNTALGGLGANSSVFKDVDKLSRREYRRKSSFEQEKDLNIRARDTQRAATAMQAAEYRSGLKKDELKLAHSNKEAEIRLAASLREKAQLEKENRAEERMRKRATAKAVEDEATKLANRTAWQKRMDRLQARGGRFAPLWETLGRVRSGTDVARKPSLVGEGLIGSMKNFGLFGKSAVGVAGGRLAGQMLFGATGANIGGMIGGAAMGGPIGIALGAIAIGIRAGFDKLVTKVQEITGILKEIASERAFESTSLRRKMQMSPEMFGVGPTDIEGIDKKIYALRDWEQEAYKRGLAGRDITTSAIDWLHLLGTKESGGTFANEKEAFDFASALSSIAKMNGLSAAEYETVRYQGMQILSKGYADILDIKPLLNSAPGFVRDLLQQTGMSRKELLESGRGRTFTAEKFKQALLNVQDYYETLSMRASSRTTEQQDEAAKNIIGRAAVWDEMYEKEKAASNTKVTNAIIEGELMNDIKESWYQMWSDENDAKDGIVKKVEFEKKVTQLIWKGVMGIYTTFILVKNAIDIIANSVLFIFEQIGAGIASILKLITNGLLSAIGSAFTSIGETLHSDQLKEWGENLNPNSTKNKNARQAEEGAPILADEFYETYQKGGDAAVKEKFPGLLERMGNIRNVNFGGGEMVIEDSVSKLLGDKFYNVLGGAAGLISPVGAIPGALAAMTLAKGQRKTVGYGYTSNGNVADLIMYERPEDKKIHKYRDKKEIEAMFRENWTEIMGTDANGNAVASGIVNQNDMSGATASYVGTKNTQNFAKMLGLSHENAADYTFQDEAKRIALNPSRRLRKNVGQDIDDMNRALDRMEKAFKESDKEYQNVKAPDTDKKIGELNKTMKGNGGKTGEILDVLKEIAGVTVINKVTRVRPDVVFNYGSYGRNGKAEDPHLKSIGDGTPQDVQFAKAVANEILNLMDNEETGFEQSINDMPSTAYA